MELVSGFCFAVWLDKITEVLLVRARRSVRRAYAPPQKQGLRVGAPGGTEIPWMKGMLGAKV